MIRVGRRTVSDDLAVDPGIARARAVGAGSAGPNSKTRRGPASGAGVAVRRCTDADASAPRVAVAA